MRKRDNQWHNVYGVDIEELEDRAREAYEKYEDIINLPRHVSKTRKPMSTYKRAAQFAPFSALTGYEDSINETQRMTMSKPELSEDQKEMIDYRLRQAYFDHEEIEVTYFVKDQKKEGGSLFVISDVIKTYDDINRLLIMNQSKIMIDDIVFVK